MKARRSIALSVAAEAALLMAVSTTGSATRSAPAGHAVAAVLRPMHLP